MDRATVVALAAAALAAAATWARREPFAAGGRGVEAVVARYAEDLSFLPDLAANLSRGNSGGAATVTVYNKGPRLPGAIRLRNVGREVHTYLHHILTRYDTLAEVTVFLPGSCRDAEYKWAKVQEILRHLRRTRTSHFPGHVTADPVHVAQADFQLDSWRSTNEANARANGEDELQPCPVRPFGAWYEHVGLPPTHKEVYNSIFAVTREDIRRRPREFYAHLIQYVDSHSSPEAVHFVERAWPAVFHQ